MRFIRLSFLPTLLIALALAGGEPSKPAPSTDTQVYITKSGKKYHAEGCRYLSKSGIKVSLAEAKKNYTPCSVCNPPKE